MAPWQDYETILLDMDGTILDLSFDNYFWRELVPRCLARLRQSDPDVVREQLFSHYAARQGTLDWYCIDYWTDALDLDLRRLKDASSHRVRYLPGARSFLAAVGASGRRLVLVTNAHGYTLEVKRQVAGLDRYISTFVSSHELGMPKEHPDFWPELEARLGFDPATTLFVDDSLPVLDAARAHGLRGVLAVSRPDSRGAPRDTRDHTAIEALGHLVGPPHL